MISIESTSNLPDWMSLIGKTLDGGYELKEIIEAEQGRAVVRVRVLGDYTLKAVGCFYVTDQTTAEEQVSVWQSIRLFARKNNVSIPLGTGTLSVNGSTVVYLIYQSAEETLADVIASRALLADEAVEVLRSASAGLENLHGNGLVHGALSPGEILAVEDAIQVSSEYVSRVGAGPLLHQSGPRYLSPESKGQNITPAADVWCLGATLFEALTQKPYSGKSDDAANLKHPLGTVLTACLDPDPEQRPNASEIDRLTKSPAPPKPKMATPPLAATVASESVQAAAAAAGAVSSANAALASPERVIVFPQREQPEPAPRPMQTPVDASAPVPDFRRAPAPETAEMRPPRTNSGDLRSSFGQIPKPVATALTSDKSSVQASRRGWLYTSAAFAVIFLGLWLARQRSRVAETQHSHPTSIPSPSSTTAPVAQSRKAWPTKTLDPEAKNGAPAAVPNSIEKPRASPALQARTVWRVVLYTYNRQVDAQNRVHNMGAKRPDLGLEVFSPSGSNGPFLVVAGGQMNREEAKRLRARAIQEGMPRDSYTQNFDH